MRGRNQGLVYWDDDCSGACTRGMNKRRSLGKAGGNPGGERGRCGAIPGEPKAERLRREGWLQKRQGTWSGKRWEGYSVRPDKCFRSKKVAAEKGKQQDGRRTRCLESRDGKKGEWRRRAR